jgi:hypothetical protein
MPSFSKKKEKKEKEAKWKAYTLLRLG